MSLAENKYYILLIGIALLSTWLAKHTEIVQFTQKHSSAHSPDYFSKGYSQWKMNEKGTLKSKLIADKIIHYSDDETTHSINPVMYFYNESSPPWIINSDTGILSADGKSLLLNGQVTIERAKAKGQSALTINTSMLNVQPEKSYAETKEWAELLSPPNKTTGTGMNMTYIEPVNIKFLSNVKGNYAKK